MSDHDDDEFWDSMAHLSPHALAELARRHNSPVREMDDLEKQLLQGQQNNREHAGANESIVGEEGEARRERRGRRKHRRHSRRRKRAKERERGGEGEECAEEDGDGDYECDEEEMMMHMQHELQMRGAEGEHAPTSSMGGPEPVDMLHAQTTASSVLDMARKETDVRGCRGRGWLGLTVGVSATPAAHRLLRAPRTGGRGHEHARGMGIGMGPSQARRSARRWLADGSPVGGAATMRTLRATVAHRSPRLPPAARNSSLAPLSGLSGGAVANTSSGSVLARSRSTPTSGPVPLASPWGSKPLGNG